jgi:hypothetical protein
MLSGPDIKICAPKRRTNLGVLELRFLIAKLAHGFGRERAETPV